MYWFIVYGQRTNNMNIFNASMFVRAEIFQEWPEPLLATLFAKWTYFLATFQIKAIGIEI